ncbi:8450_t:CDS:2, partial [Cetraspora pellucida]
YGKLERTQKGDWEKGSSDTFDKFTYEDEQLDEIDGYYTIESSDDKINLYIEEVPTQKREKNKPTMMEQLEKFVQANTLSKEEKEEACTYFKKKSCLLTIGLNKLGKTSLIPHYVDTDKARPIKQHFYRTSLNKQEFLYNELELLERQRLIKKSEKHRAGKKHSDADTLLWQYDSPEVSSNRIEVDVSAQKCSRWLLSLVECNIKEGLYKMKLGGYIRWSVENVELIAHHNDDEWDDKEDGKDNDLKLEEYIELREDVTENIITINENRLGIQDMKCDKCWLEGNTCEILDQLGYTEPLDEEAVNADRDIQIRRNGGPIIKTYSRSIMGPRHSTRTQN